MLFKLMEELLFLKNLKYYLELCIDSGSPLGRILLRDKFSGYLAVSLLTVVRLIIDSGGNRVILPL